MPVYYRASSSRSRNLEANDPDDNEGQRDCGRGRGVGRGRRPSAGPLAGAPLLPRRRPGPAQDPAKGSQQPVGFPLSRNGQGRRDGWKKNAPKKAESKNQCSVLGLGCSNSKNLETKQSANRGGHSLVGMFQFDRRVTPSFQRDSRRHSHCVNMTGGLGILGDEVASRRRRRRGRHTCREQKYGHGCRTGRRGGGDA